MAQQLLIHGVVEVSDGLHDLDVDGDTVHVRTLTVKDASGNVTTLTLFADEGEDQVRSPYDRAASIDFARLV